MGYANLRQNSTKSKLVRFIFTVYLLMLGSTLGVDRDAFAHFTANPDEQLSYQESTGYEFAEDFFSYENLAYTRDASWDVFSNTLSIAPTSGGAHRVPAFAQEAQGGIFVAWSDLRNNQSDGNWDVYLQRIDLNGNRLWSEDLRVNSDATNHNQSSPTVNVDGEGNAILVWQDDRNLSGDIYAQKIAPDGTKIWNEDVRVNSPGIYRWGWGDFMTRIVQSAIDADGNIVVVWQGTQDGKWDPDIYAQKISPDGKGLWENGMRVNEDVGDSQLFPAVAVANGGGLIVSWIDDRNGGQDVYLQRVSRTGQRLWSTDRKVNTEFSAPLQGNISLAVDPAGVAYVVWRTGPILPPINEKNNSIQIQKVDVTGHNMWPNSRRVHQDDSHVYRGYPMAALSPAGDVVVMWKDDRNGSGNNDVYVQAIDANGTRKWDTDFQLSPAGWDDQWIGDIRINGGQTSFIWMQRDDVYYQGMSIESKQLLLPYPALINEVDGELAHKYSDISLLSAGRALVVWHSYLHGRWVVYANIIDADGKRLWPQNFPIGDFEYGQIAWNVRGRPRVDTNAEDQSLAVWVDAREGIFGQAIDIAGNWLWPKSERLNLTSMSAYYPNVLALQDGTFVVAWIGLRNSNSNMWDIYLQRLNANGDRLWNDDIRLNSGDYQIDEFDIRSRPELALDIEGSIVVAWRGEVDGNVDVYLQKVSPEGTIAWDQDIPLHSDLSNQTWYGGESMIAIAAGQSIGVAWVSASNEGYGVSVQSLSLSGSALWPTPIWVTGTPQNTYYGNPNLSFSQEGNLLAVWDDEHQGRRIFAQMLGANGDLLWPDPSVVNNTWPLHPSLSANSGDTFFVTWLDERDSNERIYVQRINVSGAVLWGSDANMTPTGGGYYRESGTVVSRVVDRIPYNISHVMLTAEQELNDGQIVYSVSNNDGASWETVIPGQRHFFQSNGSALRWKGALRSAADGQKSPIVRRLRLQYDPDLNGDLTLSTPNIMNNQDVLFLASIRSSDRPLPSLDNVAVKLGDTLVPLYDTGDGGDLEADDSLYAGYVSYAVLDEIAEATLFVGASDLDRIDLSYLKNPELLVVTDWSSLFDEFRDTGMVRSEDINGNGTHDFFDLVDRLRIYAEQHKGTIIDLSSSITSANGFEADYQQLPYTDGTAIRYEKGLMIDDLISRICEGGHHCKNITIVGDDEVVPYYRVFDPTDYFGKYYDVDPDYRSQEREYADSVGGVQDNPVLEDLNQGYMISDVPYSIRTYQVITPKTWESKPPGWAKKPEPNMGVGRVFSSHPLTLIHAIDQYEKPLYLTSEQATASLFVAQGEFPNFVELVKRSVLPDAEKWFGANFSVYDRNNSSWTPLNFTDSIQESNLVTWWGHSTHTNFQIAPDESLEADDLAGLSATEPTVVVGFGCHLGLTVSNSPSGYGRIPLFSSALVNQFVDNGITYFAPISEAYTWEAAFVGGSIHELMSSLFINQLLDKTNSTVGDVWKQVFPMYHSADPAIVETDNDGVHLFHIAGAYGTALYGLPTQPIDRVSSNAVEVSYSSMLLREVSAQTSIPLHIRVPNFLVKNRPDGTSLFGVPNGGAYLAPTNGPVLPLVVRLVSLPSNYLVTGVRLVKSESEVYDKPITLTRFPTISANGVPVDGEYEPSGIYPQNIYSYTMSSTTQGTKLRISAIPMQFDTESKQVTLYSLLEFAIDGIISSPANGPQISSVIINQEKPLSINKSQQKVTVDITSHEFDNIYINWVVSDQAGYTVSSGRAPLHVIDGTTTIRFALDTYDWLPGSKDLAVSIQKDEVIVSSTNRELTVQGISIQSETDPAILDVSGSSRVVWDVRIWDEYGSPSTNLQSRFTTTLNEALVNATVSETEPGVYRVQLSSTLLANPDNRIRVSVTDQRGIMAWRDWSLLQETDSRLFLPMIQQTP